MRGWTLSNSAFSHRYSRRQLGRLLAGTGLSLATLSLLPAPARAQGAPVLYTWEGFDSLDLVGDFTAKHGAPPIFQTFVDENEALENLKAGFTVDLAHPCADTFGHWNEAGLLQPIDTSRLSNWPDLFERLKTVPGNQVNGKQLFIPVDWGTTSVAYRSDLVESPEESYRLLWDDRYAGKLSIGEDATETVMMAALVAGVADPFDMSAGDLARVETLLNRQKPLLKFYWSDDTVLKEAVSSGDIVATSMWSDTFRSLKQNGVPVSFMRPKEGILSWCCGLVLAKAATEVNAAYELIDAILAPATGVKWIERGSNHANRKTYELIDERTLAELGVPRDPSELLAASIFLRDYPRLAEYQQMFDETRDSN
jgi:spermidine/putrescine transport system substrate-binding protein